MKKNARACGAEVAEPLDLRPLEGQGLWLERGLRRAAQVHALRWLAGTGAALGASSCELRGASICCTGGLGLR